MEFAVTVVTHQVSIGTLRAVSGDIDKHYIFLRFGQFQRL